MKLVYGHEITEDGRDELVDIAERANKMFSMAASPGWLVDIFPACTQFASPLFTG